MTSTIRVHSADSHLMEPDDLWMRALPGISASGRRPCRTTAGTSRHVDGRAACSRMLNSFAEQFRPPGAFDLDQRLLDLDREGVVAQLAFPSRGFWICSITDPALQQACVAAYNDWAAAEVIARTDRVLPAAIVSTVDIDHAVAEVQRARRPRVPVDLHADVRPGRHGVRPRPVGPALGGDRGHRHGARRSTSAPAATRRVPRSRRRGRELLGDVRARAARRDPPGRRRRARPASRT